MDNKFEIGGEFRIEKKVKNNQQFFELIKSYGDNYILLDSGRSCIRYICEKVEIKVVLLPNYICESVITAFSQMNFKIIYYSIDENLSPTLEVSQLSNIGIFFHMGYFGFNTNNNLSLVIENLKSKNVIIVEDITHSLLSQNNHEFKSDYYLCSLRKWFGIYDGAFIASDRELPSYDLQNNHKYLNLRKKADEVKSDYFQNKLNDKSYLQIYSDAEKLLDELQVFKMSDESKNILNKIRFDQIKQSRRSNYLILQKLLENKKINIIPLEANTVPLCLPLFIIKRDEIRSILKQKEVYCPIHWPIPKVFDLPFNKIFEKQLSIPIDQRYNILHMQYINNILQDLE